MPKFGESKAGRCPQCGKRVQIVYQGSGQWKGYCKCGKVVIESESDATKIGGQYA